MLTENNLTKPTEKVEQYLNDEFYKNEFLVFGKKN